jgi:hypothetical protein
MGTLAARRREAGDMPGAALAYEAALAEQPANLRLLRNARERSAGLASPAGPPTCWPGWWPRHRGMPAHGATWGWSWRPSDRPTRPGGAAPLGRTGAGIGRITQRAGPAPPRDPETRREAHALLGRSLELAPTSHTPTTSAGWSNGWTRTATVPLDGALIIDGARIPVRGAPPPRQRRMEIG